MTLNITQQDFKKLFILAITSTIFILTGCQNNLKPPENRNMSQLEWRSLQTRTFEAETEKLVLKALLAALQDEGYSIESTSIELGLVTAVKEISKEDSADKAYQEFWVGKATGYQTSELFKVSCTVSKRENGIRVRLNMTAKGKTESGGTLWSQAVQDPKPYQNIFNKIDKSVFLQKEKL